MQSGFGESARHPFDSESANAFNGTRVLHFFTMSMAEFYMDNGIDPGDPDSLDAFMGGLEHGHSGGAYM